MAIYAQLKSGSVVELKQDCDCKSHDGPHWVHEDKTWAERNRQLLAAASDQDKSAEQRAYSAMAVPIEEGARLNTKLFAMQGRQIARLIDADTAITDLKASGYRIEGPGSVEDGELEGRFWWTLHRERWSGIECSTDDFSSASDATCSAIESMLKESATQLETTKA